MPLFALLIKALFGNALAFVLLLKSTEMGAKLAAVLILAAAYVACVVGFSTFVVPLVSRLFSTSYGQVIGLAFPPIAGTVITGVVGLWGCIVLKRYYFKFTALLVK